MAAREKSQQGRGGGAGLGRGAGGQARLGLSSILQDLGKQGRVDQSLLNLNEHSAHLQILSVAHVFWTSSWVMLMLL